MAFSNFLKSSLLMSGLVFATVNGAFAFDNGDAANGESVFKKCMSCHMVGPEAKNKVGPPLNELFGRQAGTYEGYKYGKSLVAAGEAGLVWNDEEVFAYLADPKKYLRTKLDDKKAKSKMSFRLKKEDDRADVIAYLKTFSTAPEEGGQEGEDASTEDTTATN